MMMMMMKIEMMVMMVMIEMEIEMMMIMMKIEMMMKNEDWENRIKLLIDLLPGGSKTEHLGVVVSELGYS